MLKNGTGFDQEQHMALNRSARADRKLFGMSELPPHPMREL